VRAAGVILPLEGRPGTRRASDSRPNGRNGPRPNSRVTSRHLAEIPTKWGLFMPGRRPRGGTFNISPVEPSLFSRIKSTGCRPVGASLLTKGAFCKEFGLRWTQNWLRIDLAAGVTTVGSRPTSDGGPAISAASHPAEPFPTAGRGGRIALHGHNNDEGGDGSCNHGRNHDDGQRGVCGHLQAQGG
jgi:hypothetical protein